MGSAQNQLSNALACAVSALAYALNAQEMLSIKK